MSREPVEVTGEVTNVGGAPAWGQTLRVEIFGSVGVWGDTICWR